MKKIVAVCLTVVISIITAYFQGIDLRNCTIDLKGNFRCQPVDKPVYQGIPVVIDGDTLSLEGTKIRLYGIDAPESKQHCFSQTGLKYPCGKIITEILTQQLAFKTITCKTKNKDQYQRVVATCHIDNIDINAWLVENGYAVAYTSITKAYLPQQTLAQQQKRGIWAGYFDMPWEWRKGKQS